MKIIIKLIQQILRSNETKTQKFEMASLWNRLSWIEIYIIYNFLIANKINFLNNIFDKHGI